MRAFQFELHAGTAQQGKVGEEIVAIRGAADRTKAMIAAVNFAKDWAGGIPEMQAVPQRLRVTNYVSARYLDTIEVSDETQRQQAESWATRQLEEQ